MVKLAPTKYRLITEIVRWGDSSPALSGATDSGSGPAEAWLRTVDVDTGNVENEPILCSYKSYKS